MFLYIHIYIIFRIHGGSLPNVNQMVTSGHSGIQPGHNTGTIKWLPLGILVFNQDITQVQLNG